ncbi:MAG: NAD-dependent epimerase/dehydratase family protein [Betaproteobacteria bacterium]
MERATCSTAAIAGGSGFVGRHVCAALYARGHRVVVGSRHPRKAVPTSSSTRSASCASGGTRPTSASTISRRRR